MTYGNSDEENNFFKNNIGVYYFAISSSYAYAWLLFWYINVSRINTTSYFFNYNHANTGVGWAVPKYQRKNKRSGTFLLIIDDGLKPNVSLNIRDKWAESEKPA